MQSFHLISGLLEHNQSFDDIWSCCTVAWLTSSNTPSLLDWTLCYWSMFIRVFGGSGQVTALHCSLPRVPHYWAPCRCQPTQCPPFLLPWLRQHRPRPAGPLRALLNWPRPSPNFLMITMIWINTTIMTLQHLKTLKRIIPQNRNLMMVFRWFVNKLLSFFERLCKKDWRNLCSWKIF